MNVSAGKDQIIEAAKTIKLPRHPSIMDMCRLAARLDVTYGRVAGAWDLYGVGDRLRNERAPAKRGNKT